jgi:hypothetical protein
VLRRAWGARRALCTHDVEEEPCGEAGGELGALHEVHGHLDLAGGPLGKDALLDRLVLDAHLLSRSRLSGRGLLGHHARHASWLQGWRDGALKQRRRCADGLSDRHRCACHETRPEGEPGGEEKGQSRHWSMRRAESCGAASPRYSMRWEMEHDESTRSFVTGRRTP